MLSATILPLNTHYHFIQMFYTLTFNIPERKKGNLSCVSIKCYQEEKKKKDECQQYMRFSLKEGNLFAPLESKLSLSVTVHSNVCAD